MNIMTVFKQGAGAVNRNKKLWLWLWLTNLLFSLLLVLPVYGLASNLWGHSLYAVDLAKKFDLQILVEFLYQNQFFPTMIMALWLAGSLLYMVLTTFLLGGVLEIFVDESRPFTSSRFFGGCGRYFPRFFVLLLFSLLFYGAILLLNAGLSNGIDRLLENCTREKPMAFLTWLCVALIFFLMCLVNMTFDYAKIRLVVEESSKAARATVASLRFIGAHFSATLGLFFLIGLLGVIFFAACLGLTGIIEKRPPALALGLGLVLQQSFILSKIWVRLTFYSSQLVFFRAYRTDLSPPIDVVSDVAGSVGQVEVDRPNSADSATTQEPLAIAEATPESQSENHEAGQP